MGGPIANTKKIDNEILSNSIFRSIYIQTMCKSSRVHKQKISYEFGKMGESELVRMIELGVIVESDPDIISTGPNRSSMSDNIFTLIGKDLCETHFYKEKLQVRGENMAFLVAKSVDPETYNELLKVEWKAKEEKLEILKRAKKGNIPFWNYSIIDQMSPNLIYETQNENSRNGEKLQ
jgi:hypothetical protein